MFKEIKETLYLFLTDPHGKDVLIYTGIILVLCIIMLITQESSEKIRKRLSILSDENLLLINEVDSLNKKVEKMDNIKKSMENLKEKNLYLTFLYEKADQEKRCFYHVYSECFKRSSGKLEDFNHCLSHSCSRLEMSYPRN